MICKEVKSHQKERDGKTSVEWLEEHVKNCEVCQGIIFGIKETLAELFSVKGGDA